MSALQKQTSSTESLEKFAASPYALLVVAGVALACVMACAVVMALALAPGIAQTRAIILNAEAAQVAQEQKAKVTLTPVAAKTILATPGITATAAAVVTNPTPPTTPGKPPPSPIPSPTLVPGAPTPQRSPTPALPATSPAVGPSFTPVVPVIATTPAPILPPTFTPVPGATTAPTATPSPTTAAQAPTATPTATNAPNQELTATNTPAPTATPGATPTPVVYPPGATLISGTIKISAVHPDIDYPANEYIELTNVGAQNVALLGLRLIINNPSLEPPAVYSFGSGVVLEPGFTCRVFTGMGGSSSGGGTSLSCNGLTFKDRNSSLMQASEKIELRNENFALLAIYVYVR